MVENCRLQHCQLTRAYCLLTPCQYCPPCLWNCWDIEPWNAGFHLAVAVASE